MEYINPARRYIARIGRKVRSLLICTLCTAIASGIAARASAQTFAEWFEQKKTQKRYLLQQIAALQVFSGYLKQGYRIADHGLGAIAGSLKAENTLHTAYYHKLRSADPAVSQNARVKDILVWQAAILSRLDTIDHIAGLTGAEKTYVSQVRAAVLNDCGQQMASLHNMLSDQGLEMSDDERLSLLANISRSMQENYLFASGFSAQVKIYALQRQQQQNDIRAGKQLYGIN